MLRLLSTLRMVVRLLVVALLVLGVLLWLGRPAPWREAHIGLGYLLGIAVIALGAIAARVTGRVGMLLVIVAWTAAIVWYGLAHARFLPGSAHWVAQLVHVILGLATAGLAEAAAGRAIRGGAPVSGARPNHG